VGDWEGRERAGNSLEDLMLGDGQVVELGWIMF